MQTYAYGTSKYIIQTNEEIKYKSIIKKTKMVNFDVTGGNIKEHNCLLSTFFAFFLLLNSVIFHCYITFPNKFSNIKFLKFSNKSTNNKTSTFAYKSR